MVGALQFEVLMAIVGTEKFSSAIGLVLLMEAIAVLVGPPGAGQSIAFELGMLLFMVTVLTQKTLFTASEKIRTSCYEPVSLKVKEKKDKTVIW